VERAEVEWLMTPDAPDLEQLLAELVNRPAWHRRAACRGRGHEEFVIGLGRQYDDHVRQLCGGCPVRQQCLEVALADADLTASGAGRRPWSGGCCGGGERWRRECPSGTE
jgi:Transcription factor WhiB